MLTESETEYVVKCTKHVFAEHIVFEYSVTNTLNDQILENAQVVMEGGEQEIDADDVVMIAADKIAFEETASTFVAFPSDPTVGGLPFALCSSLLCLCLNGDRWQEGSECERRRGGGALLVCFCSADSNTR